MRDGHKKRAWRGAVAVFCLTAVGMGQAEAAGKRMVFVTCPVLRNTALPCWMARYKGELYFVDPQADLASGIMTPEFNHKMLVEGRRGSGPRVCGGVPLTDVHVSVLPDLDPDCNVMLPSEGYADPPAERSAGPSGVKGAVPPAPPPRRPPPAPLAPPFKAQAFNAVFDADTDRLWQEAQQAITAAARLANAAKAAKVRVVGYRAAIGLSDGGTFVERPGLAQHRAEAVAQALKVVGLPSVTKLDVSWQDAPIPAQGTPADVAARKVVITVEP